MVQVVSTEHVTTIAGLVSFQSKDVSGAAISDLLYILQLLET